MYTGPYNRATQFIVSGFPTLLILGPPWLILGPPLLILGPPLLILGPTLLILEPTWLILVVKMGIAIRKKHRPSRLLIRGLSRINNSIYIGKVKQYCWWEFY